MADAAERDEPEEESLDDKIRAFICERHRFTLDELYRLAGNKHSVRDVRTTLWRVQQELRVDMRVEFIADGRGEYKRASVAERVRLAVVFGEKSIRKSHRAVDVIDAIPIQSETGQTLALIERARSKVTRDWVEAHVAARKAADRPPGT